MANAEDSSQRQGNCIGKRWRLVAHRENRTFQAENEGVFDELVVDDWLHIEQMDDDVCWLRVGDARLLVSVGSDGSAKVDIERGAYGQAKGTTTVEGDR